MKVKRKFIETPAETVRCTIFAEPHGPELGYARYRTIPYYGKFEAIVPNSGRDPLTKGRYASETKKEWNSFQHYKRVLNTEQSSPLSQRWFAPIDDFGSPVFVEFVRADLISCNNLGQWGEFSEGLVPYCDLSEEATDLVVAPTDLDELVIMSLKSMIPRIKNELSLINTIIELKDWVTLKHSINGFKHLLERSVRTNPVATLRQLVRSLADAHLQMSFNVRPFLSDLQGVYLALTKSLRTIEIAVGNEGRPLVHRFKMVLENECESVDELFDQPLERVGPSTLDLIQDGYATIPWMAISQARRRITSTSVFRAQMRYNANYSAFQRQHAEGLALLDALGINFNPEIVWDAMPWTFVVDWFVKVGEFCERYKVGSMDPLINILDYSWSVRREREIRCEIQVESTNDPFLLTPRGQRIVYPLVRETAYRRSVGLPEYNSFITSGLTPYEFSLAAALVLSRRRRPTRTTRKAGRVIKRLRL